MPVADATFIVGALLSVSLLALGQTDLGPPVFRAGVALVTTDVTVVDRTGHPVSTLGRDDFTLSQDGRPQVLLDVRYVVPAGGGAASAPTRTLVLLIDDEQLRVESALRLKSALLHTLPAVWQAGDVGAVLRTSRDNPAGLRVVSSLDALLHEARALNVLGPAGRPPLSADACRDRLADDPFAPGLTSGTLGPLEQVLRAWSTRERRVVVLLFAEAVSEFRCPAARASAAERLRRLADLAARRGAVVYGLQPSGLSSGVIMPESRGPNADAARAPVQVPPLVSSVSPWLKALTERTGGTTVRPNDIGAAIRHALREQDGYYLLTYEPPAGTFTAAGRPRYRKLEVRTTRSGLTVRGRSGFYSVPDDLVR